MQFDDRWKEMDASIITVRTSLTPTATQWRTPLGHGPTQFMSPSHPPVHKNYRLDTHMAKSQSCGPKLNTQNVLSGSPEEAAPPPWPQHSHKRLDRACFFLRWQEACSWAWFFTLRSSRIQLRREEFSSFGWKPSILSVTISAAIPAAQDWVGLQVSSTLRDRDRWSQMVSPHLSFPLQKVLQWPTNNSQSWSYLCFLHWQLKFQKWVNVFIQL